MADAKVSQAGAEVVETALASAKVSQAGAEVVESAVASAKVSQAGSEVIERAVAFARVSQAGVEVITPYGVSLPGPLGGVSQLVVEVANAGTSGQGISQAVVEVGHSGAAGQFISQAVVEVGSGGASGQTVSQQVVEVANAGNSALRVSQIVIEVAYFVPIELEFERDEPPVGVTWVELTDAAGPAATLDHSLTAGEATSLTIGHTSDTYPLYVLLSWYVGGGGIDDVSRVSGVTAGGVALTRGGHAAVEGNTMEWWRLVSPPVGLAPVVITLTSAVRVSAAVMNLRGWPTAIGDHRFAADGANRTVRQPSVVVVSASGSPVIDWLAFNDPAQTLTVGAGQSVLWTQQGMGGGSGAGGDQKTAGSTKVSTGTSATMQWTLSIGAEVLGSGGALLLR